MQDAKTIRSSVLSLPPSFMSSRSIVRNEVLNFPNQGLFSFHFSFSAQYLDSGCAVPTLALPCSCIIPPNKEKREGFPSTVPPPREKWLSKTIKPTLWPHKAFLLSLFSFVRPPFRRRRRRRHGRGGGPFLHSLPLTPP